VACSGNVGDQAALFEPVHGSAPKLAGTGKANPIAAVLSAAMMLDYLGEDVQAGRLRQAVKECIAGGLLTEDMGGTLSTSAAAACIIESLKQI
jgi:homoisocitrate dehydrogenase